LGFSNPIIGGGNSGGARKGTPLRKSVARAGKFMARSKAANSESDSQAELRSTCPVACTLDLVGDRWTLLVVRDLMRNRRRFGALLESPERIPTNILADRLKRLERAGVIASARYNEHPPRYEYSLTEKGLELGQAITALADWGLKHYPGTKVGEGLRVSDRQD
jgi:DNA-binding HxlR family transcriptional regulator